MDPLVYEEIILTPTSTIGKEQTIICYHNHSFVWEERVVVFVIYFHQVFKILRIMTLVIPSSVYILKRIHHRTCLYVNLIVKKKNIK